MSARSTASSQSPIAEYSRTHARDRPCWEHSLNAYIGSKNRSSAGRAINASNAEGDDAELTRKEEDSSWELSPSCPEDLFPTAQGWDTREWAESVAAVDESSRHSSS